jgi:5-formyltetrahydrofolate cyclo-ligase
MTKQELRKIWLEKRQSLSEGEYLQLNHRLCENFFTYVDLSFVKVVHTFLPITEKHEPDTWLIIERVRREFSHIRLSVPKVNIMRNELENFYFEGLHQLGRSSWGVLEPKQGTPTPADHIDLVLVPLLAFDKQGQRLGYGKGYYDKFLALCRTDTTKIGLSLFPPGHDLPTHNSDIRLDGCITPEGYTSFQ